MRASILATLLLLAASGPVPGAQAEKVPVILDTDFGTDIDDAFALALVLASPELDLQGITTVSADAYTRAMIVCRLLDQVGRTDVPVAAGRPALPKPAIQGQYQYGLRPLRKPPVKESAVEFLYQRLKAQPGKLTLLAVGDLTNIGRLLSEHPDCKPWIKRIVIMGGAVRVGYNNKPPAEPEWNIKSDVKNAQVVFAAGVPLVVAPLDATTMLQLDEPARRKIFGAGTPLANQLHALYQLWDKTTPTLFDPVAVMLCADERLCKMEELRLEVDDKGLTKEVPGKPNARVAVSIQKDAFLKWYVDRVAGSGARPVPPKEVKNASEPVAQGGFPGRIHVTEDYETDIERRWWLVGKLETKNVPPGSTRACRGVLTNNFDGRKDNTGQVHTAVVFNPVPGPPLGKNTRLSFRYWLKGTPELRVQIYSLSNGYHRYLTLGGLPQERWEALTVDMTACRRPDGSGGPLSEDERIDDIQFYADPAAELLIDDVVLYDAAPLAEKRPFPRPIFTGWFDTGAQGKEWPGDYAIVPKEKPLTWKAAKSVPNANTELPWIRLSLRGERPLGDTTLLSFRYRLTGADTLRVVLPNRTMKAAHTIELKGLKQDAWAEALLDLAADLKPGAARPRKGDRVDEIQFLLPKGAELLLDDVLLYEPGVVAKK